MLAVGDRAPLVVDRVTGSAGCFGDRSERVVVDRVAGERRFGVGDPQSGRGNRAEGDSGGRTIAVGIEGDLGASADHGDVHFGARDHAEVGVAGVGWWSVDLKLDDELVIAERGFARSGRNVVDRHGASAVASGDDRTHIVDEHRWHRVRSGRGVAQVAAEAGTVLNLIAADETSCLAEARQRRGELGVLGEA